MTSIRAKRTSKAPTRFSSDNDGSETISSTGETILDYTNNTTKTTHTLSPVSKAIRLKTTAREPLKVKLPKLKRSSHHHQQPQHQQHKQQKTKEKPIPMINSDIKIHKIKLPSLLSKKSKQQKSSSFIAPPDNVKAHSSSSLSALSSLSSSTSTSHKANTNEPRHSGESLLVKQTTVSKPPQPPPASVAEQRSNSSLSACEDMDASNTSRTSREDKSIANTSFTSSSDGEGNVSGMKIVVSQPDASSGSEIRCPCGVDDDLGIMVQCERCSTWQHGHCINVGLESDAEAYEGYICAYCLLPEDKFRESLIQLTVGDRFQARFDQLESLLKRNGSGGNAEDSCDMIENHSRLTLDELSQAIKELSRVLNSLRTKWRLLISPAHESELRIWQNPYWTDEVDVYTDKEKSLYHMDRYKRNLKLNIRNIIKLMERRCSLIEYAIKLVGKETDEVKSLLQTVEAISNSVKEYRTHSTQVLSY